MEANTHHLPCAACRMLRRRCDSKCPLAPYFPTDEVDKFAGVHRVFGASNVIKMIQMVEETKREDAVKAIVYEAMARVRDPVHGSAGAISHLQNMVQQLKVELEAMKARISQMQEQRDQLLRIHTNSHHHLDHDPVFSVNDPIFDDYYSTFSSVDVYDLPTAYNDPVQFPVQGDWVL